MEFVASVGNDKENWGQILTIIKRMSPEKIVLVKNSEVKDFPDIPNAHIVSVNLSQPLIELRTDMMTKLRKVLAGDFEVALSLASGNGKEHMALVASLINLPVGVRLVVYTQNGLEFIT